MLIREIVLVQKIMFYMENENSGFKIPGVQILRTGTRNPDFR